jgi:F-type H+-transporting ATPase subunit gamma
MAGVSSKEIKNRIRSMESTKQITKAMELVAASKLRRAQSRVISSRPYFEILQGTVNDIVRANRDMTSHYLKKREGNKVCFVAIAGDRGLAGGYNSNILKMVMAQLENKEASVVPVGRKAVDFFRNRKIPSLTDKYMEAEKLSIGECFSLAKELCKRYLAGEFDEVWVGYTNFVSVLSQTPATMRLLPLSTQDTGEESRSNAVVYEPNSEDAFAAIVPEYLGGILYGALCESAAAEQAARRSAMDSATQNADEMIDRLSLQFNRARQAAITQEITEIIAGSN